MGGRGLSHLVDLEAYITEHLEGEKKKEKKRTTIKILRNPGKNKKYSAWIEKNARGLKKKQKKNICYAYLFKVITHKKHTEKLPSDFTTKKRKKKAFLTNF